MTGPFLAIPAGVTVLAGLVYEGIRRRKTDSTALNALRQEWISGLDEAAKQYQEAFAAATNIQGLEIIDRANEILLERVDELAHKEGYSRA